MALHYDLYENPLPDNKRKKRLHARVVTQGTTATEDLAYLIHSRCSLTPGDIKAALSELADVMAHELSYGKRVHLEGLGYFQLTLEKPPVREAKDIRGGRIHVKSIAFCPEVGFKNDSNHLILSGCAKRTTRRHVRKKRWTVCCVTSLKVILILRAGSSGHCVDLLVQQLSAG